MEPPSHLVSRRQVKLWRKQQQENAAKRQKVDSHVNPFRFAERQFKAPVISDDTMAQVIDTCKLGDEDYLERHDTIKPAKLSLDLRQEHPEIFGTEESPGVAMGYTVTDIPGLILIPNPFTPEAQRRLVQHCLTDYARPPNTSNLDAHYDRPSLGIWDLYERYHKGTLKTQDDKMPIDELLRKQRWVTLGYQYDWKTKVYDLEHGLPMPSDLDDLAKAVVKAVEGVGRNTYSGSFTAEAGVINYYQLKDTLMAHVDKSEVNMEAPLVSVSFGHACIYLIGGADKDTPPAALCLRSGDLLVMSGSSRLSYHGVPRILENTLPDYLESSDDEDWKLFGDYMSTARINLNLRQVFP